MIVASVYLPSDYKAPVPIRLSSRLHIHNLWPLLSYRTETRSFMSVMEQILGLKIPTLWKLSVQMMCNILQSIFVSIFHKG